jgi:hypothetical protein
MSDHGNRPMFICYMVVKDAPDAEQGRWIPIGAAWAQKDGKGFNLSLDFLPMRMPGKHYAFVLRENASNG